MRFLCGDEDKRDEVGCSTMSKQSSSGEREDRRFPRVEDHVRGHLVMKYQLREISI